jgi:hypothetical protein
LDKGRNVRHDASKVFAILRSKNARRRVLVLVAMASYGQVDATSAAVSLALCIPITIASTIAILIIGYRSAPYDSRSSINTDAASQIYRLWQRIRGRGGLPAEILRD